MCLPDDTRLIMELPRLAPLYILVPPPPPPPSPPPSGTSMPRVSLFAPAAAPPKAAAMRWAKVPLSAYMAQSIIWPGEWPMFCSECWEATRMKRSMWPRKTCGTGSPRHVSMTERTTAVVCSEMWACSAAVSPFILLTRTPSRISDTNRSRFSFESASRSSVRLAVSTVKHRS